MLVVTRYRVPADDQESFLGRAEAALRVLVGRPGCTSGRVGRAVDDPGLWTLTTTWESVGAYRRALSSYDVKVHTVPLMYQAIDEPAAYEDLLTWTPSGGIEEHRTAIAADGGSVGPGRAAIPDVPRDLG